MRRHRRLLGDEGLIGVAGVAIERGAAVEGDRLGLESVVERPAPRPEVPHPQTNLLPGGPVHVGCATQSHSVGQVADAAAAQQGVDRGTGVRGRGERTGSGGCGADLRWGALARLTEGPALAAAGHQHPAAAVGGHVAPELLRCDQLSIDQPVQAVGRCREVLLDRPARRRGSTRAGAVTPTVCRRDRTETDRPDDDRAQADRHHQRQRECRRSSSLPSVHSDLRRQVPVTTVRRSSPRTRNDIESDSRERLVCVKDSSSSADRCTRSGRSGTHPDGEVPWR